MKTHRLLDKDGTLYFPHGGHTDTAYEVESEPALLLARYDAGDCDTIPWPLKSEFSTDEEVKKRLARALYDERETNRFFGLHAKIELPDGTPFDFDSILAETHRYSESPDYDPAQKPNY